MSYRIVYAMLIFGVVGSMLVKNDVFAVPFESIAKHLPQDNKPFAEIARDNSTSEITIQPKSNRNAIGYNDSFDKHLRTPNDHRSVPDSKDKFRYDSNSPRQPDAYYDRSRLDSNRYSIKFGERLPADRYGWQSPDAGGSTGRPPTENHAGPAFYEKNPTGNRFIAWHSHGGESSRKPGNYDTGVFGGYGYGVGGHGGYGFTRPTGYGGGYGISGTVANGDEVGPVEPNYSDGDAPPHPNIQAQKAVALKALAGVALLGAAAALATNPVLLPLGVISGRKRRSNLTTDDKDIYLDYISTILKNNVAKHHDETPGLKVEPRRNYVFKQPSERRSTPPISSNVIVKDVANVRVKKFIQEAAIPASYRRNCDVFTCTYVEHEQVNDPALAKP